MRTTISPMGTMSITKTGSITSRTRITNSTMVITIMADIISRTDRV